MCDLYVGNEGNEMVSEFKKSVGSGDQMLFSEENWARKGL